MFRCSLRGLAGTGSYVLRQQVQSIASAESCGVLPAAAAVVASPVNFSTTAGATSATPATSPAARLLSSGRLAAYGGNWSTVQQLRPLHSSAGIWQAESRHEAEQPPAVQHGDGVPASESCHRLPLQPESGLTPEEVCNTGTVTANGPADEGGFPPAASATGTSSGGGGKAQQAPSCGANSVVVAPHPGLQREFCGDSYMLMHPAYSLAYLDAVQVRSLSVRVMMIMITCTRTYVYTCVPTPSPHTLDVSYMPTDNRS